MNTNLPYFALILLCVPVMLRASPPAQGPNNKPTPDQIEKVHSRLFTHKGPPGQIPDMLSKGTGVVKVPCIVPAFQRVQLSFADDLAVLASKSDLVVVGKAETGKSHMNDDKSFLYSDWTFTVEEVLKGNQAAPAQPGATILVTRSGGQLVVNGRLVHAHCSDFRAFDSGQEYLLFLTFVPETGAYTTNGAAVFALSQVRRLDEAHYHHGESPDKDTLLKTAREAVARISQARKGG